MFLAFGVTFEVPVFVIDARPQRGGCGQIEEARPYVIVVGAFVVAAVLTRRMSYLSSCWRS